MTKRRQTVAEVRQEVAELLDTEGLRAAAEAAIAVCRDAKAPAAARATASGLIFRFSEIGGFGKGGARDDAKEPHEMNGEEVAAALADLRRQLAGRQRGEREELGDGVFD